MHKMICDCQLPLRFLYQLFRLHPDSALRLLLRYHLQFPAGLLEPLLRCIQSALESILYQAFLCHPSPEAKPFRELGFNQTQAPPHRILLAMGPEGGFSPQEVEQAKGAGMQMIKMGRGILKTDTAFVAASSFFRLMYS